MSHSIAIAAGARSRRAAIGQYFALTKPGIIMLLLVTTVPAMVLAEDGMPGLWLIAATLIGGALASGGAGAINSYVDRGRDRLMRRTARRPLPMGEVEPQHALYFGIMLGIAAFIWLVALVNLLTAVLAIGAMLFYVLIYSVWLKPATPQNIVIGGAAGAVPPLCGWAAVTGGLDWPPLVLFAIVFLWTPPHFWALALRFADDYERAHVPMLPVVRGERETKRQILIYTVVLIAATLVLWPVAGTTWFYPAAAVALGAGFLWHAVRLYRRPGSEGAMRVFAYSIVYLALLFGAVALDVAVSNL